MVDHSPNVPSVTVETAFLSVQNDKRKCDSAVVAWAAVQGQLDSQSDWHRRRGDAEFHFEFPVIAGAECIDSRMIAPSSSNGGPES